MNSSQWTQVWFCLFETTYLSWTSWKCPLNRFSPTPYYIVLTHLGRETHICVSKVSIIGWDNGLSPGRRQAIIWTNAGILLIWPLGTNFNKTSIEIHTFSFKKVHLKLSSGKWRPFCLGLNVLSKLPPITRYRLMSYHSHLGITLSGRPTPESYRYHGKVSLSHNY